MGKHDDFIEIFVVSLEFQKPEKKVSTTTTKNEFLFNSIIIISHTPLHHNHQMLISMKQVHKANNNANIVLNIVQNINDDEK